MKQGWYWLAAGVMAVGLNHAYHDAGVEWAQRIGDQVVSRSAAVLALASGRAERFGVFSQLATEREPSAPCAFATGLGHLQTRMNHTHRARIHFEAMTARQEAALARLEANRARIEAQVAPVRFEIASFEPVLAESFERSFQSMRIKVPVACPRVRVKVPRNLVTVPIPEVHVEAVSAGPV